MNEREHAETVARDVCVYLSAERDGDEIRFLADLIERERAEAKTQELERVSARHADAQDMVLRQTNISQAWQEGTYRERERDLRAKLERAAAAQMRAALSHVATLLCPRPPCVASALATDVGAGYVSPEQHARAVAEARRQALEEAAQAVDRSCGPMPMTRAREAIRALLEKP